MLLYISVYTLCLVVLSGRCQALVSPSSLSVPLSVSKGNSGKSTSSRPSVHQRSTVLNVHKEEEIEEGKRSHKLNRSSFLSIMTQSAAIALFPSFVQKSNAAMDGGGEETATTDDNPIVLQPSGSSRTIEGCPKPISGKPNNCIATSNIKQLENYSPPWTFEVPPEEAFARLKGLMKTDSSFDIVELDENAKYMKVDVQRTFNTKDQLEFLVKGDDKVVVFKSNEIEGIGLSDLGINKKRVDGLRLKSGGVFRLMGEGLTADSVDGGKFGRRNGVAGQLKAFYGLQSGEGLEYVFED